MKDWIVSQTAGYCGADLKALCAEAALVSLKRCYPQVYSSTTRLQLDPSKLVLREGDFAAAMQKITAASRRSATHLARPLESVLQPLLQEGYVALLGLVKKVFPVAAEAIDALLAKNGDGGAVQGYSSTNNTHTGAGDSSKSCRLSAPNGNKPNTANGTDVGTDIFGNGHHSGDNSMAVVSSAGQEQEEEEQERDEQTLHALIEANPESWIAALTDAEDVPLQNTTTSSSSSGGSDLFTSVSASTGEVGARPSSSSFLYDPTALAYKPRLLISGEADMGQDELAAAVLHALEAFPVVSLDLPSLLGDDQCFSPEQALVKRLQQAYKSAPSIVYFPHVEAWLANASEAMKLAFLSFTAEAAHAGTSVFWLSTTANAHDVLSTPIGSFLACGTVSVSVSSSSEYDDVHSDGGGGATTGMIPDSSHLKEASLSQSYDHAEIAKVAAPTAKQVHSFYHRAFFSQLLELPAKLYRARMEVLRSHNQHLSAAVENEDKGYGDQEEGAEHGGADQESGARQDEPQPLPRITRSQLAAARNGSPIRGASSSSSSSSSSSGGGSPLRPKQAKWKQQLVRAGRYTGEMKDYPGPYKDADNDERDAYHLRELRNFLRLSLGELHKDKRFLPFWRPVDPEVVLDYYDIVKCPMDLETMRAKVDEYVAFLFSYPA